MFTKFIQTLKIDSLHTNIIANNLLEPIAKLLTNHFSLLGRAAPCETFEFRVPNYVKYSKNCRFK